jgi:uncharacterized damage-inducible protein DinB
MRTETLNELKETAELLQQEFRQFEAGEVNLVPFENSWTAGQVMAHLGRSHEGMLRLLNADPGPYEQKVLTQRMDNVLEGLVHAAETLDLEGSIKNFQLPVYGSFTRLEILWFVICHSKRHTHQLKNIRQALVKK